MTQANDIDIPLPPELPAEYADQYRVTVRELVAEGGDAERIARDYSAMVRQFREAGIDALAPAWNEPADVPIADAIRWLETAADPVVKAFLCAPVDDEPETDSERAAVAAGLTGPCHPQEVVTEWIAARGRAEAAGEPAPSIEDVAKNMKERG